MKAITIRQPWASLVAEGVKRIETRGREHPWRSAIGETIAVHAAMRFDAVCPDGGTCHHACTTSRGPERSGCYRVDCCGPLSGTIGVGPDQDDWPEFPRSAIVAICTLVDVIPMIGPDTKPAPDTFLVPANRLWIKRGDAYDDVEDQRPLGDFAPGRWALLLADVRKCAPVPCRGYQGLWTLPASVADNLVGWAA